MYWPGVGTVPVVELVLRRLFLAHEADPLGRGLEGADVLLSHQQRCLTGVNGATWQAREFHRHYDPTRAPDRADAPAHMPGPMWN